jgi:hypothetical protein
LDLIDLLRSTLSKLEQSSTMSPDELAHVRSSIARSVAELEILHAPVKKSA